MQRHEAQYAKGLRILQVQPGGRFQFGARLGQAALQTIQVPDVVMRLGIIRIVLRGLLESGERLGVLTMRELENPEIGAGLGIMRIPRQPDPGAIGGCFQGTVLQNINLSVAAGGSSRWFPHRPGFSL